MTQHDHWIAKASNVWFAENTQRKHYTSPYTVYDRFVPSSTWQVVGWLIATYVGAVFVPIALQIRLHLPRPCKILTSTLNAFMCSFDVFIWSTNVPLDKTIKICSDALHDDSDLQPLIPKDVFVELIKSATSSVEFSFNSTMYKQTDVVRE